MVETKPSSTDQYGADIAKFAAWVRIEAASLSADACELSRLTTVSATAMLIKSPMMAALATERLPDGFMHCKIRMTHSFRGVVWRARQTSPTKHKAVLPLLSPRDQGR